MTVMLDSDTCIHLMNHDPRIKPTAGLDECAISQIVLGELEYGVCNSSSKRREQNQQALYDFLSVVEIHSLSNLTAACYGQLRAYLRRQGALIGPNDLWIAAHALSAGLLLVTNNQREFARVPKLAIDSWIQ